MLRQANWCLMDDIISIIDLSRRAVPSCVIHDFSITRWRDMFVPRPYRMHNEGSYATWSSSTSLLVAL